MKKYSQEQWEKFLSEITHEMQEWIEANAITPDTILHFSGTNYSIVDQPTLPRYDVLVLRPIPYSGELFYREMAELKLYTVNTELTLGDISDKDRLSIARYIKRTIADRQQQKDRINK